jgi:hypothetical protein
VVLKNASSGEEFTLTSDGKEDDAYRDRFYWSPDSQKLVAIRVEKGQEHKVSFVESSPKDQLASSIPSTISSPATSCRTCARRCSTRAKAFR